MRQLTLEDSNKIDECLNELKMLGELVWSAGFAGDDNVVSHDSLITLGEKIHELANEIDSCVNGEKEAEDGQSVRKDA